MTSPSVHIHDARDTEIVKALRAGHSVDRITEIGVYRGNRTGPAWTRAHVEHLAAVHLPPQPPRPPRRRRRAVRHQLTDTTPWTPPAQDTDPHEIVITAARAAVVTAVCQGRSLEEVATDLRISLHAAKDRWRQARVQMGARHTIHAVSLILSGQVVVKIRQAAAHAADNEGVAS